MNYRKVVSIMLFVVLSLTPALLSGCELVDERVIATVGTEKITAPYYNYFLLTNKSKVQSEIEEKISDGTSTTNVWDVDVDGKKGSDLLRETALKEAINVKIAVLKAEELGVPSAKQSAAYISSQKVQTYASAGGREAFIKFLTEEGIDEASFNTVTDDVYVYNQVNLKLNEGFTVEISDDEVKKDYDENYMKFQHILLMTVQQNPEDTTGQGGMIPIADEEKEAKKTQAEEVLTRIKNGEDFEALMNEFSEDKDSEGNLNSPGGYLTPKTDSQFDTTIVEAVKNIKVGEFTQELVEGYYGYHIVRRLDINENPADLESEKINIKSTLESKQMKELLENKYAEFLKEFETSSNQKIISSIKIKED